MSLPVSSCEGLMNVGQDTFDRFQTSFSQMESELRYWQSHIMGSTGKIYSHFDPRDPHVKKVTVLEREGPYVKVGTTDCVLPEVSNESYERAEQFPVEDTDVWLVTLPKAGTVWAQEMIWLLTNNCNFKGSRAPIKERFPYFKLGGTFTNANGGHHPGKETNGSVDLQESISPRLVKTHLPYNLLPARIQNGEAKPRIIYVARHPKDVVVSYYHHQVLFRGYKGSLKDMVEQYTADMAKYTPYWTHVREFWERRNDANILFIKYEDMHADLGRVIQVVAQFLGVGQPSEATLTALLKHLSFDSMKMNPYVNKEGISDGHLKERGDRRKTNYMRKGKIGGYKEELSPVDNQLLDKWMMKNRIEGLYGVDVV